MIKRCRQVAAALREWRAWRAKVKACPHSADRVRGRIIGPGKIWICGDCGSAVPFPGPR